MDLTRHPWLLSGWTPVTWEMGLTIELGLNTSPEIGPIPARLPGSVQKNLLDQGLLPNWNYDLKSRECEWVENRDWLYQTTLSSKEIGSSRHLVLECEGLDGNGALFCNRRHIGDFKNAFVPHTFDLGSLQDGEDLKIEILFRPSPRWLGQFGFTSRIQDFKPRFNYTWDWLPRNVQIGIFGNVRLLIDPLSDHLEVMPSSDSIYFSGSVASEVIVTLENKSGPIGTPLKLTPSEVTRGFKWSISEIDLWNPHDQGSPRLYDLEIQYTNSLQEVIHTDRKRIGFKKIEWKPCLNAPVHADPWICEINGKALFLKGINWTPIRPHFADLTESDYRTRIETYRDLGFNLFRVWGGAFLESEIFYQLCDEYGILVWQEFPLCSSGPDNSPPSDPELIARHIETARSYILRRRHHASLLCWCGGNELQTDLDGKSLGAGKPVDSSFALIGELEKVVKNLDPGHRFLPTSASGPRFLASEKEFGMGLHWDVHGPWVPETESYWKKDDSLFRSELGSPGASPVDLLKKYTPETNFFPISISNPIWKRFSFWLPNPEDQSWKLFNDKNDLEGFVRWSQQSQSKSLVMAVSSCLNRFPSCGGVIIWMGHDSFPALCNTSILDFEGRPKPAALELKKLFLQSKP